MLPQLETWEAVIYTPEKRFLDLKVENFSISIFHYNLTWFTESPLIEERKGKKTGDERERARPLYIPPALRIQITVRLSSTISGSQRSTRPSRHHLEILMCGVEWRAMINWTTRHVIPLKVHVSLRSKSPGTLHSKYRQWLKDDSTHNLTTNPCTVTPAEECNEIGEWSSIRIHLHDPKNSVSEIKKRTIHHPAPPLIAGAIPATAWHLFLQIDSWGGLFYLYAEKACIVVREGTSPSPRVKSQEKEGEGKQV